MYKYNQQIVQQFAHRTYPILDNSIGWWINI